MAEEDWNAQQDAYERNLNWAADVLKNYNPETMLGEEIGALQIIIDHVLERMEGRLWYLQSPRPAIRASVMRNLMEKYAYPREVTYEVCAFVRTAGW